jgi:hypothetical protein
MTSLEGAVVNRFDFQGMEKALGDSIIPAITFFAHAGLSTMAFEDLSVTVRSILAAPVAMKDKAPGGVSFPYRHQYGFIDQTSLHAGPHGPTYYGPGKQIDDNRQI